MSAYTFGGPYREVVGLVIFVWSCWSLARGACSGR